MTVRRSLGVQVRRFAAGIVAMVLPAPALSIDVAPRSHDFDARVFDCSNPRCYLLYAVTGTLEVVDVVQGVPVGGVVQAGSPGDADRTVVFRVVVDETSPDALPNVFVLGPAISGTGVIPDVGADLTGHFGIGGAGFIGPVGIGETSDPFFVSFPSLEPGDELLAGVGLPVQGDELGSFVVEATACDDGLDNDNDGRTDDADLGCYDPRSTTERPRCQDGLDNDNATGIDFDGGASLDLDRDGRIDAMFNPAMPAVWIADPQCFEAPWRNTEGPGCGVRFEIALIAPLLATLAGKRRLVEHGRAIRGIKKALRRA